MKIGIDGNEANIGHKVGVHQYAYELLWSFFRINKTSKDKHEFTIYLKSSPSSDLPAENKWWKYKILKSKGLWILTRLTPHLLFNRNVDVFFSPSHYLPFISSVPKVLTIHDLGYLAFSEQFNKRDYYQLKYWTAKSISSANKLIAVSKSTKKDILINYKISKDKIKVVYHGFDSVRFNKKRAGKRQKQILKDIGLNKKFILFLGTLKPSKNIEGVVEAYYRLPEKYRKLYNLVIAGQKGWLYNEIYKNVKELGLINDVIFTGFVSERDKEILYKNAKLLVQPSFWEGFGMQVLESMAMGTPVVISKVASLPEVGGEAVVYVDHNSANSIMKGIKNILDMDEVQYNKLVDKGFMQVKKFSWERAGKETLDVLIKTANENRK